MTATTIRVQMAQRKDTAANWTAANPILLSGEIGYETDTKKFKIGNGSTNWNSLAYLPIPDGSGNLTITGNLEIGSTGSLTFEGSTADGFETTLAVTNPTADRTITLPDRSGTVITSGDTGTVTSTMILDGTIVNGDVNASAAIAGTKITPDFGAQTITTTGGVGIGTTSPSTTLSIGAFASSSFNGGVCLNRGPSTYNFYEASDGTNTVIFGLDNNLTVAKIGSVNSYPIGFFTGNAERLRITAAGLVGIGTSSPQVALQVGGTTAASQVRIYGGSAGSTYPELQLYAASSDHNWTIRGNHSTNLTIGKGTFGNYGSDLLTLTAGGSLGIGTTNPDAHLTVQDGTNNILRAKQVAFDNYINEGIGITFGRASDGVDTMAIGVVDDNKLIASGREGILFATGGAGLYSAVSESARIDSSGRLLVGTSTNNTTFNSRLQVKSDNTTASAIVIDHYENDTSGGIVFLAKSRSATVGTMTVVQNGDTLGEVQFWGADGTQHRQGASIKAQVDGTPGASDMPGRLVFSTTADGASSPTERMRIDSSGRLLINTTGSPGNGNEKIGISSSADGIWIDVTGAGGTGIVIDRTAADGDLINFLQAGAQEGVISVSGTTVTYGGGHLARWSQLPNNEDPSTILKGTVMSNLDEMCEWGDEDNEQLNKTKISDVEGDKNVAGVFVSTSFSDDGPLDFFVGMTGDMVIRIGAGVTVERGDLLISAGDGTAKPQDDDIIRSKTIAKVTSTNVSCTYDDGSYCVPCVLMAC